MLRKPEWSESRIIRLVFVYLEVFGSFIPQHDVQMCEGLWRQLFSCVMACVGVKMIPIKMVIQRHI